MSSVLDIAIVADDLTGAADTGVQFCPSVGPVYMTGADEIALDAAAIRSTGLAVFTDTRSIAPALAADTVYRVARAIRRLSPRMVYKKIDSCLRGNLGAETDAMLSALEATASFVSPALPQQGRTTVNDCHRVNGTPVAETEIGRDPLCPVYESRLSVLLASQSQMPVGHVHIDYLEKRTPALFNRVRKLLAQGCRHIVFDARETEHLDAIASLSRNRFENILLVGSAGLAGSLSRIMTRKPALVKIPDRPRINKWLFICGSASQVLADQAAMLARSTGWPLEIMHPSMLAAGKKAIRRKALFAELTKSWRNGGFILCIAPRLGNETREDPDRVVSGLANVVASLLPAATPEGLFLSGGDTAVAVLHQAGGSAILLREEILPGLMRGEIVGGPLNGLPVFTKPGAFGQPDMLIELLHSLT